MHSTTIESDVIKHTATESAGFLSMSEFEAHLTGAFSELRTAMRDKPAT